MASGVRRSKKKKIVTGLSIGSLFFLALLITPDRYFKKENIHFISRINVLHCLHIVRSLIMLTEVLLLLFCFVLVLSQWGSTIQSSFLLHPPD